MTSAQRVRSLHGKVTFPVIEPTFQPAQWVLPTILAHQAAKRGGKVFLRWMPDGSSLTFGQTQARALQLSAGFQHMGVTPGERVVLLLSISVDHLLVWFGLANLGAVDAPINTAYIGDLLVHQVNLVDARVVVIEAEYLQRILDVGDRLEKLETIVIRGSAESLPAMAGRFKLIALESLYREPLAANMTLAPRDAGTILYTSGTTGPSKGVLLSHGQLHFFAEQSVQLHRMADNDVMMAPVPLFHASGRIFGAYAALIAGATYAMYEKFSGSRFVDRLHESGSTVVHLLGAMMFMIHSQSRTSRDRGHHLRSVFSGPTAYDIADDFVERFGIEQIVEGLGQTEVCQPVLSPPGVRRPHGAAGVVMAQFFEARVVDPATDEEVPDGVIGEYVVRPKVPWLVTLGYERMPEKTLEATRNLWFHTGDAVKRDAAGWFYFIDRMKDCIRRRGENVSSHEIEAVIQKHPAIAEAAALAVKADPGDPEDEILVCLVRRDNTAMVIDELVTWTRTRLPEFAVPRYFRVMESLPKTANDKVQKVKLREQGVTPDTHDRHRPGDHGL